MAAAWVVFLNVVIIFFLLTRLKITFFTQSNKKDTKNVTTGSVNSADSCGLEWQHFTRQGEISVNLNFA